MNLTSQICRLSAVAAAAALALAACNKPSDTGAPTSGATSTGSTSSSKSSDTTVAGGGITPNTGAMGAASGTSSTTTTPSAMVGANPPGAVAPSTTPNTALSASETSFVNHAAEDGMFEVEIAKVAATKATDPAVKSFAQRLVDDHTAANDKLRQIAASHNITLPASMPASKQKDIDRLNKLSGAQFDREFIQMVGIKDHKTDIDMFEKISKDAKASDLRDFAQSTLPTLREHLAQAQKLPGKS